MSFFKNLGAELGTGAGRGLNVVITSIWKIFSMFCGWLFRWQHREGEHSLHTNSFRIAVGSFILALFFMPGLVTCSFNPLKSLNDLNPLSNKKETVTVKVQLTDNNNHSFPPPELFIEEGDNDKMIYSDIGDVHFILYQKRTDGRLARVQVGTKLCSIVPAGKSIVYETIYKPVHAVNMKNKVYYTKKEEFLTIFEKISLLVTGDKTYRTSSTWTYLNANWLNSVDANYTLIAEALDLKDLPDSYAKGGLVCF